MNSYEIIPLGTGFWAINDGGVRMYLIDGDEFALLVDTGFGAEELRATVEGLVGKKPVHVFLTHGHYDHVGGCKQFSTFYAHPDDLDSILPEIKPEANVINVDDGDIIDVGGRHFEVLHFPGHTPGSIGLYERSENFLIAGDNVSDRPVYMYLEGADIDRYTESLCRIALLIGNGKIYASHGTIEMGIDQVQQLITLRECIRYGLVSKGEHVLPSGSTTTVFTYRNAALLYGG